MFGVIFSSRPLASSWNRNVHSYSPISRCREEISTSAGLASRYLFTFFSYSTCLPSRLFFFRTTLLSSFSPIFCSTFVLPFVCFFFSHNTFAFRSIYFFFQHFCLLFCLYFFVRYFCLPFYLFLFSALLSVRLFFLSNTVESGFDGGA